MSRIDYAGLPDELLAQLKQSRPQSTLQGLCVDALRTLDGHATVDEILVYIYRKHDQIVKRKSVYVTLHRLRDVGDIRQKAKGIWELTT